jgi:succinate dehydrogenase/fumarate reductase flavoprotein subunit
MAAKRAKAQKAFLPVDDEILNERVATCAEISDRKVGFHWKEVEIAVQNLMDFYCGNVRNGAMLRRGLERLEDAKSAPFKAENPHELGRVMDVKSIIDNAELVLRSSLERKESRPPLGFIRADYPKQDDENLKVFLAIKKEESGEYTFKKIPI